MQKAPRMKNIRGAFHILANNHKDIYKMKTSSK